MIPRLAPRRSRRRSSLPVTGVENTTPFPQLDSEPMNTEPLPVMDSAGPVINNSMTGLPVLSAQPLSRHHPNRALHRRRALSDKAPVANAPLSPSPSVFYQADIAKSPMSCASISDMSSDFSVTPPATGPRPFVVSAKRIGKDVRRKHSKRRRRRGASKSDNVFCLWKDENDQQSTQIADSSDDDNDVRQGLPFLFTQQEVSPTEQTRHYWIWCYGKTATTEVNREGWSAKRAPPNKSCLSNPRPRRKLSPSARFKTPPTSPEELEEMRKNSANKSARVQFGSPSAAEYEIDGPAVHLTPMPSDVTRKLYSMDQKEQTYDEEEVTHETKQNSAVLAQWEEEFDEPKSSSRRKRKNKNRRSSSLFTPSPMLMDKDGDPDGMTPPRHALLASVHSPSVVVMENLASLRMGSPDATDNDSFSRKSLAQDNFSAEIPVIEKTTSSCQQSTVEFKCSLQSVDTIGGAMDTTPPHNSPAAKSHSSSSTGESNAASTHAETTPPPTNVNLDSIHTVGGALDLASPATSCHATTLSTSYLSPISRMSNNQDMNTSYEEGSFEAANHAVPADIVKILLNRPSADQEWETADVFRNLSKKRQNSPIKMVLESINACQNGVLSCVDDLKEMAKYCANTKSSTKFKLAAKDTHVAQQIVGKEWKQLELEFLGDLSRVIERTTEKVKSLADKAKCIKLPASVGRKKGKGREQLLQKEIAGLEEKIQRQRDALELVESAEAPLSVLQCQANSHIGICGFRLDAYTGDSLQLSYEHVVEGVESKFDFDLKIGSVAVSRITDSESRCQRQVASDHVAAVFHTHFLSVLANGTLPLLQQLETLELPDTILKLSRWLGRLDLAALDLAAVSEKSSISIKMPEIILSCPNASLFRIRYDYDKLSTLSFIPSSTMIAHPGKPEAAQELPSDLTAANCFHKILGSILRS